MMRGGSKAAFFCLAVGRIAVTHGGDERPPAPLPPTLEDVVLLRSANEGSVERVRTALRAGASVDATGEHDYTALHFAALKGWADVARELLESGASSSARGAADVGQTAGLARERAPANPARTWSQVSRGH